MANPEHLAKLAEGVDAWNSWVVESGVAVDLVGAQLHGEYLSEINLRCANLARADLGSAQLVKASLRNADLTGARLRGTDFTESDLGETCLRGADLRYANLAGAVLENADLRGADLREARLYEACLIESDLDYANFTGCFAYGISVWNVSLRGTIQNNIVITPPTGPSIQVDNLEMAQFIYLLQNNAGIRHVIDTITSKVVLILGRFTQERKVVLNAIRDRLREHDYVPILFDFDKPQRRDTQETVTLLARMARFVIADITDPKSIPQELVSMVEQLPSVPAQPILMEEAHPGVCTIM